MSHPWTASRVGSALAPPPGQIPNYVNPINHDAKTIALHTVCMTVSTLLVSMRIGTRTIILKSFGCDDAFVLIGWAFAITTSAIILKDTQEGIGTHLYDLPKTQTSIMGEWLYIGGLMSKPGWCAIKLAFFWSYYRVFTPDKTMKYLCLLGGLITLGLYVGEEFHDIFICIPVQKDWEPKLKGHCLPNGVGGAVTSIYNVISDIYILILPLPFVQRLHMRVGQKLRLYALFGAGVFVNAASITRLVITYKVENDPDLSWKLFTQLLWITLELNVGLWCVCCLVLPRFSESVLRPSWVSLRSEMSQTFHGRDVHTRDTNQAYEEKRQKLTSSDEGELTLTEQVSVPEVVYHSNSQNRSQV